MNQDSIIAPLVSVVVPIRNEGRHLKHSLGSLAIQSYPSERIEILAIDGGSTDHSREIINEIKRTSANLHVYDNPEGTTSTGMNVGIRVARGSIIVIAGAHAFYPIRFIENCVAWLERTQADVVGGPVKTESCSHSLSARVACAILSSRFGVGNSRFRTSNTSGFVDTVPFGAYRKEIFERIGLFNEKLIRNQDNDLSARVRRNQGKIYFTDDLATIYFAPESYFELLNQTLRKTQWHAPTLRESPRAFGYRHFVPAMFFLVLNICVILALFYTPAIVLLLILLIAYFSIGALFSFLLSEPDKLVRMILPLAYFPFHVCYGFGTILGLRFLITPPKSSSRAGQVTVSS